MKRVLMTAVVAAGVCGLLAIAADEVTSVNAVGYVKQNLQRGLNLVREDFLTIDGADATPEKMIGDQLPIDTTIYMWNGATYDKSTYMEIEEFDPGSGGFVVVDTNWNNASLMLDPGAGFWVRIPPAAPETTELTLLGEVPNNPTSTIPIGEGLNLVGSPYPVDVKWVDTDLAQQGEIGDILYVWNGATYDKSTYMEIEEFDPGSGGFVVVDTNWNDTNITIKVGQGFFFKKATGATDWVETRPYDL